MQRILLILAMVLTGGAAWAAAGWSMFHDPAGLFAVELPAPPTVAHHTVKGVDGSPMERAEYTVGDNAAVMLVTVADLSRVTDPRVVLDAAVKGADSGAARDLSDTAITLDGHDGRHVGFIDAHGSRFDDMIFLVGKNLVQVIAVQTQDAAPTAIADLQRFRASFHFVGK